MVAATVMSGTHTRPTVQEEGTHLRGIDPPGFGLASDSQLTASLSSLYQAEPEDMTLERFQRDVVRSTFMMSQGRQWLQIPCLDSIFRILLAQGVEIDWELMGSPEARSKVRRRALPPGHVPVDRAGQVAAVFEFWLQCALWVGRYVYDNDAGWLPSDDRLDEFAEVELGLEPWMSSATEEELAGMKVMFGRYRDKDPYARLTADEAILRFTIPFWIKADRHWVSGARTRPGVLGDPHGSMIQHLIRKGNAKLRQGWRLTVAEQLYVRAGELLAEIEATDPAYPTLPTYRKLIAEYNAKHPGAEVDCLHR
jgi:hypothetical protein